MLLFLFPEVDFDFGFGFCIAITWGEANVPTPFPSLSGKGPSFGLREKILRLYDGQGTHLSAYVEVWATTSSF